MKVYLSILFIAVGFVVVCESRKPEDRRKPCDNDDDCSTENGEKQCCVKRMGPFPGKGRCSDLKKEGDRCLPAQFADKFHKTGCPCRDGLECISRRTKITKNGILIVSPKCRNPSATTVTPDDIVTVTDDSSSSEEDSSEEVSTIIPEAQE